MTITSTRERIEEAKAALDTSCKAAAKCLIGLTRSTSTISEQNALRHLSQESCSLYKRCKKNKLSERHEKHKQKNLMHTKIRVSTYNLHGKSSNDRILCGRLSECTTKTQNTHHDGGWIDCDKSRCDQLYLCWCLTSAKSSIGANVALDQTVNTVERL